MACSGLKIVAFVSLYQLCSNPLAKVASDKSSLKVFNKQICS